MPTYTAELEVHAEERPVGEWKEALLTAVRGTAQASAKVQQVGAVQSLRSEHTKLIIELSVDTPEDAASMVDLAETQLRSQQELRETRPWLIQGPVAG